MGHTVMKVTVAAAAGASNLRTDPSHRRRCLLCSSHIGNKKFFFRYFTILYLKFKLFGINLESASPSCATSRAGIRWEEVGKS